MANLDPAALRKLREDVGGESAFEELVTSFLEEGPALTARARQALQARDLAGLQVAAHTLKGLGLTFGAARLAQLCRDLEESARQASLIKAASLVPAVEQEWAGVQRALSGSVA